MILKFFGDPEMLGTRSLADISSAPLLHQPAAVSENKSQILKLRSYYAAFQFYKAIIHLPSLNQNVLLPFAFLSFTVETVIFNGDSKPFRTMQEACSGSKAS